ncbi:hypothetical protein SAMN05660429_02376 [Thalassotalea agarivorans]|uniref:Uncharacterized protein n=1 Tax=Thalassotalea agarivorans TaxID=349064 RepID=A0A1I0GC12_THASX|nr:hypothetical protein SAMN05660429_02376 [Thalassotalea agarivorans]
MTKLKAKSLALLGSILSLLFMLINLFDANFLFYIYFSSSLFFYFLYLNPGILVASKADELDSLITQTKAKYLLLGTFISLAIGMYEYFF